MIVSFESNSNHTNDTYTKHNNHIDKARLKTKANMLEESYGITYNTNHPFWLILYHYFTIS